MFLLQFESCWTLHPFGLLVLTTLHVDFFIDCVSEQKSMVANVLHVLMLPILSVTTYEAPVSRILLSF